MRNGLIKLIAVIWAVAAGPGTVGVAQAQPASRSQSVPKYPVKPVRMLGGAYCLLTLTPSATSPVDLGSPLPRGLRRPTTYWCTVGVLANLLNPPLYRTSPSSLDRPISRASTLSLPATIPVASASSRSGSVPRGAPRWCSLTRRLHSGSSP